MDKIDLREIRLLRLKQLIAERFGGLQTEFAIAAKKNPTQVTHWVSGHRNPNGDTCRQVEKTLDLPLGWLDGQAESTSHGDLHSRFFNRLATADPATLRLIELALYENDEEAAAKLTPSLVAMVRGVKAVIQAQGDGH